MRCLIFGKGGISGGIREALPKDDVFELTAGQVDVRRPVDVRLAVLAYTPDWVVNCAGVDDEERFLRTIQTNLAGTLNVANAAAESGIPSIHIASVAGLYGKPNHTAYCASKAGVISVVQSLGFEQDIWSISPGRVNTKMRDERYPNDTPGSRLEPVEVGEIAARIVAGEWLSGTNIIIRKVGLSDVIVEAHIGDGWRERLRVGEPVTI